MPVSHGGNSPGLESFKAAASATGTLFPQEDEDIAKDERAFESMKSLRSKALAWGGWGAWVALLYIVVDQAENRSAMFAVSGALGLWWRLHSQNKLATVLVNVNRDVAKTRRRLHAYRFGDTVFSRIGTQVGSSDALALLRHWVIKNWHIRHLEDYRRACLSAEYPDNMEALVGHIPWQSDVADQMRADGTYEKAVLESWRMACALRGAEADPPLDNPASNADKAGAPLGT